MGFDSDGDGTVSQQKFRSAHENPDSVIYGRARLRGLLSFAQFVFITVSTIVRPAARQSGAALVTQDAGRPDCF
jgi:hypothetical protein